VIRNPIPIYSERKQAYFDPPQFSRQDCLDLLSESIIPSSSFQSDIHHLSYIIAVMPT
jgi:hypothetical protein